MQYKILKRSRILINTDPQRRCYNGAHFSSELVWSQWESLGTATKENAKERLKFWRELNDYAVSQRGKEAKTEFKLVAINPGEN